MTATLREHSFANRLAQATVRTDTVLCVGIDPHCDIMPEIFGGPGQTAGSAQAISHLRDFALSTIDAATELVPAIKPQAAFFERHGPDGLQVLAETAREAQSRGLLVIMDAKRGDIGSTAQAYAEAWLGSQAPFASDALTVNPYLGFDSLEPFIAKAKQTHSGLFVLLRTSNKGSCDLQQKKTDGKAMWAHLAEGLSSHVRDQIDADSGLSSIGVVVGATGPEDAKMLRQILPAAPFLIPGYGAQGASAQDALSGLIKNPENKKYNGGLINASRAITHGADVHSAGTVSQAVTAIRAAIMAARKDLSV